MVSITSLHFVLFVLFSTAANALYPIQSESRTIMDLSGFWKFQTDPNNVGLSSNWYRGIPGPYILMPVPSSFNDVTQNNTIRTYFGWMWYETSFFVPSNWASDRVVLRFESAQYNTMVWLNGNLVLNHSGGHLPFEASVNPILGGKNLLVVAVNNTLSPNTIPPGEVVIHPGSNMYPPGYRTQNQYFDFFNYAGINRPVKLYTTPKSCWIGDFTITYTVDPSLTTAYVHYDVYLNGSCGAYNVSLVNANGVVKGSSSLLNGTFKLSGSDLVLWNPGSPYLYTLEIKGNDVYRFEYVGIRSIHVQGNSFLINYKPFYFHGVDKHEDADIRGAGLDYVIVAKDYNLLKWMSANAYRTSHNPYAEEFYQWADREGIVIIDESTAVGLAKEEFFNQQTVNHLRQVMSEIIARDKNHPSVVMWSVANEPNTAVSSAFTFFQQVVQHVRQIDPTNRPVTLVNSIDYTQDNNVGSLFDVICVNRYYAWYTDSGRLDLIGLQLENDLRGWYAKYKKPIIMSEYGADTLPGMERDPPLMFSESFQIEFMQNYWNVFDKLRKEFLIGELIWNFADFATDQGITRVGGRNFKGVLTRQRQPKSAAYALKNRYESLDKELLNNEKNNCQKFVDLLDQCKKEYF